MCGRYGFSVTDLKRVYSRFSVVNTIPQYKPRYNISPGQMNLVVVKKSPNQITSMFWGLIPHWAKDMKFAFHTINARAEGIEKKPVYKKPLLYQRCLVPATGFYEWDKSLKPSVPYFFHLKDEELFAFAGLYDTWKDPKDGKELQSYSIITTEANDVVSPVHPRMPVILSKEDEESWLDPDMVEPERILPFLKPYPSDKMTKYRVSPLVNNPRNDSEELIKPLKA